MSEQRHLSTDDEKLLTIVLGIEDTVNQFAEQDEAATRFHHEIVVPDGDDVIAAPYTLHADMLEPYDSKGILPDLNDVKLTAQSDWIVVDDATPGHTSADAMEFGHEYDWRANAFRHIYGAESLNIVDIGSYRPVVVFDKCVEARAVTDWRPVKEQQAAQPWLEPVSMLWQSVTDGRLQAADYDEFLDNLKVLISDEGSIRDTTVSNLTLMQLLAIPADVRTGEVSLPFHVELSVKHEADVSPREHGLVVTDTTYTYVLYDRRTKLNLRVQRVAGQSPPPELRPGLVIDVEEADEPTRLFISVERLGQSGPGAPPYPDVAQNSAEALDHLRPITRLVEEFDRLADAWHYEDWLTLRAIDRLGGR